MQRKRSLVGANFLGAFPIHAMTVEPRGSVESVALVGPPAVDADVHHSFVNRPITRDLAIRRPAIVRRSTRRQWRRGARVIHRARECASLDDDVNDDTEMLGVK